MHQCANAPMHHHAPMHPCTRSMRADLARGKLCLFFTYLCIILALMLVFSFTPFYSHDNGGVPRNETGWRQACDENDMGVLDLYGLS